MNIVKENYNFAKNKLYPICRSIMGNGIKNKFSTSLVFVEDFENPKKIKNSSVDCIISF